VEFRGERKEKSAAAHYSKRREVKLLTFATGGGRMHTHCSLWSEMGKGKLGGKADHSLMSGNSNVFHGENAPVREVKKLS